MFFGKRKRVSGKGERHVNYDHITEADIPGGSMEKYALETAHSRIFDMQPVEYLRYRMFLDDHMKCTRREDGSPEFGAAGGGFTVMFRGTGLGWIVECRCEKCGTVCDLTDNSNW